MVLNIHDPHKHGISFVFSLYFAMKRRFESGFQKRENVEKIFSLEY